MMAAAARARERGEFIGGAPTRPAIPLALLHCVAAGGETERASRDDKKGPSWNEAGRRPGKKKEEENETASVVGHTISQKMSPFPSSPPFFYFSASLSLFPYRWRDGEEGAVGGDGGLSTQRFLAPFSLKVFSPCVSLFLRLPPFSLFRAAVGGNPSVCRRSNFPSSSSCVPSEKGRDRKCQARARK